ncbi:MAG: hypothetical protein K0U47_00995 [Epsilonproteobacteria bacterium]|nr:hypothetical protein [Campylobacterota bacterium]
MAVSVMVRLFFIITDRWFNAFKKKFMDGTFGEALAIYKSQTRRWQ